MRYGAERSLFAAAALVALPLALAQQPGTSAPEVHSKLLTWECTTAGGCVEQETSVVRDWNYRWIHTAPGSASCTTAGGVNATLCSD